MITDHGMSVPIGSDDFDPEGAVSALATSLESMVIVTVASEHARDALVAAHGPTLSAPLFVYRSDLDEIQYTTNGTKWRVPGTGPIVRVERVAAIAALATFPATYTISFDTERDDSDGMWSDGQPTRLTIVRSGFYMVNATYVMLNNGGQYLFDMLVNGSAVQRTRVSGVDSTGPMFAESRRFTAGDYIEFVARQTSGANRTFSAEAAERPRASVVWMHS